MDKMSRPRIMMQLPYLVMLAVNLTFIAIAFSLDDPVTIFNGFLRIISSRSILVTDYIAIGGIGAAFSNSAWIGVMLASAFAQAFVIYPLLPQKGNEGTRRFRAAPRRANPPANRPSQN